MKKGFLYVAMLAVAGTLAFSSCKKDDDGNTKSRRDMIVGVWTSNFEADDDNNNKVLDENEKVFLSGGDVYTQTFNNDGTGTAAGSGFSVPFTWALQNNDNEVTVTALGSTSVGYIHTISDNQFIIEDRDSGYDWIGLKK